MLKVYAVEQWHGDAYEGSWDLLLVTSDAKEVERYRRDDTNYWVTEWEIQNEQSDS